MGGKKFIEQEGKPNRKKYSIIKTGRAELRRGMKALETRIKTAEYLGWSEAWNKYNAERTSNVLDELFGVAQVFCDKQGGREMNTRKSYLLVVLAIVSLLITQCSPAAPTAAPTEAAPTQPGVEATTPPEATTAPEATEPAGAEDYTQAAREETVIFDIDGGRVADPENWNPYIPTGRRDHGFHQVVMEPLFILNYETGEIEPWLGESMTANEAQDVWKLKIRDGIKWSDSEAFNADDVVFSIQLLIDNGPTLNDSAAMKDWIASVSKVDDLTVEFALTRSNPRFQLDYFSVCIWGGVRLPVAAPAQEAGLGVVRPRGDPGRSDGG